MVNTASQCGYTPQYEGLEALYKRYQKRGLVVVGFPSNDFGGQEPGSNREVAQFCQMNYGVSFPMFEKTVVAGPQANPFYATLAQRGGGAPRWNFHKYLIDRSGNRVLAFDSTTTPGDARFVREIERLLAEPPVYAGLLKCKTRLTPGRQLRAFEARSHLDTLFAAPRRNRFPAGLPSTFSGCAAACRQRGSG